MSEKQKHKTVVFLQKNLNYIIALAVFLFFTFFGFLKAGKNTENGIYDLLLRIKPEVAERNDVLLLNIDDFAIEQVGSWPWPRDIIADALVRLKETGGKAAVFDIEYLSAGRTGANSDYVEHDLPKEYKAVRNELSEYIEDFSDAVSAKNIPLNEVKAVGKDMSLYFDSRIDELSKSIIKNVFRDNDAYMGNAVRFFGNAYLTINAVEININSEIEELKEFAYNNFLFDNVEDKNGLFKTETAANRKAANEDYGIAPTIMPILQGARGAGFPNVIIDSDGVRRRIPLFSEYNGKYIGQLVFTPVLKMLEPEKIIRENRCLILKNALNPKNFNDKKDIIIPLDEDGNLLINWLKKRFTDTENPENGSFKSLSVYALIYADLIEKNLIDILNLIYDLQIRTEDGFLTYHDKVLALKNEYEALSGWKSELLGGGKYNYEDYFEARQVFFDNFKTFLDGGFDVEIHEVFEKIKEQTGEREYETADEYVTNLFTNAKKDYKNYIEHCDYIKKFCNGAFSVIGYSGVGTSDLGVNPFWNSYPNVGTHANIYNTIMNEAFITPLSKQLSLLIAFILTFLCAFVLNKIENSFGKILFGILFLFFILGAGISLFIFGLIYLQLFTPIISFATCFLIILVLDFVFTEKEKSFLRKAFGVYLSDDVVNEIVSDPEKLALGGEKKRITALFTDIKSFSTLSEKITPEHLVSVLNIYLTQMSDLILAEKGTIDKYIGDAIVSFFGAPTDLPDHAYRACLAAVRMKQIETELNKKLYESGDIPMPIFTRIGINTGDMVVGNMGTEKKMNYTIMGNDVNLAARLEGVNKKYGTWILVSESTWNETNGAFLGRRLDRVRVVGINTPVQLYNIICVKSEAEPKMIKLVEVFENAITCYREKQYEKALALFKECLTIAPDDEPSKMFFERMSSLISDKAAAAIHDDIVNMTSK
ncbi:CHASE2 domain-containing protein [Treponema pedis]|uniref:CHASE2 domain-containing protein n=1 Tax=Treponema pedis TaxID=409322 RepID=UPI00041E3E56|nr:CHASE2 domain-containing protein [Treponema pedis]